MPKIPIKWVFKTSLGDIAPLELHLSKPSCANAMPEMQRHFRHGSGIAPLWGLGIIEFRWLKLSLERGNIPAPKVQHLSSIVLWAMLYVKMPDKINVYSVQEGNFVAKTLFTPCKNKI